MHQRVEFFSIKTNNAVELYLDTPSERWLASALG